MAIAAAATGAWRARQPDAFELQMWSGGQDRFDRYAEPDFLDLVAPLQDRGYHRFEGVHIGPEATLADRAFPQIELIDSDMAGGRAERSSFGTLEISRMSIEDSRFDDSAFGLAIFREVHVTDTSFARASFPSLAIHDSTLVATSFDGAILHWSSTGTDLQDVSFVGATFEHLEIEDG